MHYPGIAEWLRPSPEYHRHAPLFVFALFSLLMPAEG